MSSFSESTEILKEDLIDIGLSSFIFIFDECCLLNFTAGEHAEDCITPRHILENQEKE
jgi:hypothetical protein